MKKVFFLMVVLSLVAGNVYAQSAADMPQAEVEEAEPEDIQEAYGEVVSTNMISGSIVISEYDYERDRDVNKTYKIDKAATYENVESLAEIKPGDWIALTLKPQKGGADLATSVYVERYDFEEEPEMISEVEPEADLEALPEEIE